MRNSFLYYEHRHSNDIKIRCEKYGSVSFVDYFYPFVTKQFSIVMDHVVRSYYIQLKIKINRHLAVHVL